MNETRLPDALLLETVPPYWVLLIVAVGAAIMIPGLLAYGGIRFASLRPYAAVLILSGAFFVLFPLIFLLAYEDFAIEINRPPGRITLRDDYSRAELPAAAFHSLYVATRRDGSRTDYRLYLRRSGGRNIYIDDFDSRDAALTFADPISAMIGLPIVFNQATSVQSADASGSRPAARTPTAALAAGEEARIDLPENPPRLRTVDTEHGRVYYWPLRQYWLILPTVAWAGILYLLFFIMPRKRGWSIGLVFFQIVWSAIFLILVATVPVGLFGRQCILPGETALHAWIDLGGLRLRQTSVAHARIDFFQHVINDPEDPFLTAVPGRAIADLENLSQDAADILRKSEQVPDVRIGGVNPFMIPLLADFFEKAPGLSFFQSVQVDLRGLSLDEKLAVERAVLARMPAALRTAPTDPDLIARKMQAALLRQF